MFSAEIINENSFFILISSISHFSENNNYYKFKYLPIIILNARLILESVNGRRTGRFKWVVV